MKPLYALSPVLVVGPPDRPTMDVWSATLTVDQYTPSGTSSTLFGCDNDDANADDCTSAISDDDFTYAGKDYAVEYVIWDQGSRLVVGFEDGSGRDIAGATIASALSALTLNVGGTPLAFSDATTVAKGVYWTHSPIPAWTDRQKVSLKLTIPRPFGVEAGDFDATPGDRHVVLNWVVRKYDDTRAKWQFRYKDEDATSYGAWTDVPNCDMRSCWSHRVSGLTNVTAYTFQVRAVSKEGVGSPASEEQTATPRALIKPVAQKVPADWVLIPEGLGAGDRFRLLFITSATATATGKMDATSTSTFDYDFLVQDEAIKSGQDPINKPLYPGHMVSADNVAFATEFRALVSTATVDARVNTLTTGSGVAIYWLGGEKVADNYADFYDGSWDGQPTDREGNQVTSRDYRYHRAWTGTIANGTKDPTLFLGSPVGNVRYGAMHFNQGGSVFEGTAKKEELLRLFGISPVLTVAPP